MSQTQPLRYRQDNARAWLGSPSKAAAERLARALKIGQPVTAERVRPPARRGSDLDRELEELRAKVMLLEQRLLVAGRASPAVARRRPPFERPPARSVELSLLGGDPEADYWLCRCQRFAVYAGDRRMGVVVAVRFQSRADCPDLLEIRTGRLSRRPLFLPATEVEVVEPNERRISVYDGGASRSPGRRWTGRLGQLLAPLHAFLH